MIAATAAVLTITASLGYLYHHSVQSATPQTVTVGIAPFDVVGTGAEQVAESFRLELMDSVSRMPSVQVRAAHSFRTNKQDSDSIRALARTLDLEILLFGKFTLEGDRCWLQLELVRGSDATHLASLQYSGTLNQLTEMRTQAQHDLFLRLQVQETPNLGAHGNTVNAEAYRHYLKARYLISQRTDNSLHDAIDEFELAINNDPSYAKAYSGMANAHIALAEHGTAPFDENYRAAKSLTEKALSLDPLLAEAQALDGYIAFRFNWDLTTAQNKLRKAIELEPGTAAYHIWYSIVLTTSGQFDAAFHQLDFAEAADPFWPAVYVTDSFVANAARDHKRSIDAGHKLIELMPDWPLAFDSSGWAYWNAGQNTEAIQAWRQMAVLDKDEYRQKLEGRGLQAFRHGGVAAYARVRLQAIAENAAKTRNQNDFVPEEWYAYAGDKQRAIKALQATVDSHRPDALNIALNPAFDSMHDDLTYLKLVKKVGVPLPMKYSTSK
jgi:Tfp pilus assembly protein PilF